VIAGGGDRQVAGDAGAHVRGAFQRHPAAMQADDVIDQSKAQARAAAFTALKPLEDFRLAFRRDAFAVVGDPKPGFPVVDLGADLDHAAGADMVQRVGEKIIDHLFQARAVGPDKVRSAIGIELDFHPAMFGPARDQL
jgi:hypothetical protein